MFSDLKRYVDRDFLNAHRTVKFETTDGVQTFTVAEVLKTNTSDAWYDRIAAEDSRQLMQDRTSRNQERIRQVDKEIADLGAKNHIIARWHTSGALTAVEYAMQTSAPHTA